MYNKAVLIVLLFAATCNGDLPCNKRKTDYGYVCVCNSTYCDTLNRPEKLQEGQFHFYYTSNESPGFNHKTGFFRMQAHSPHGRKVEVNAHKTFQTIRGFGGSFTDSFGYVFNSLSKEAQELLLKSFFSENGIEYTLCRVALGASDFSLRAYTYADNYDPSLKSFNLTEDDYIYKIDQIKRVLDVAKRPVKLIGSTWTPPDWMKTNKKLERGYVKREFRQVWADYHVKILDAFKNEGVQFWALTTGNEPITLYQIKAPIPNLVMFPEEQRDWVIQNLGPALEEANYTTKIILLDDQRMYALWFMDTVMRNPLANDYVHGIGLHWYFDNMASPAVMDLIHEKYPDQEILYTESSINPAMNTKFSTQAKTLEEFQGTGTKNGFDPVPPKMGSWHRGALYLRSIIENLSHWVTSFVDWNLSLDTNGGPNLARMSCDTTIVINKTSDEFYKSPMFYAMGHFSKFMPPGSKIIDVHLITDKELQLNSSPPSTPPPGPPPPPPSKNSSQPWPFPSTPVDHEIQCIGSTNPDGSKTVIFYNPLSLPVQVGINDGDRGQTLIILEPLSVSSVIYW